MPVEFTNHIQVTKDMIRGEMHEALNRAAKEHVTVSRLLAPKKTRRLARAIRVKQRATARKPEAIVQAGGVEVDGVFVDYAAAVNYGSKHTSPKGTEYHIPAQPFWEEGIERGKEALMAEAERQARSRGRRGRAGVQHADTPEQLSDFFLNEGVE